MASRNPSIHVQLRQNKVLRMLSSKQWEVLLPLLDVAEYKKGEMLAFQGRLNTEQYFILDGILKKTVANSRGREIILSFAARDDIEGAYPSWRIRKPSPYSFAAVTRARVARLPMQQWGAFISQHPKIKEVYEQEILRKMDEELVRLMDLQHLDAPGRVRYLDHRPSKLLKKIPQKDLAAHLNMSAETFCRLKNQSSYFAIPETQEPAEPMPHL